MAGKIGVVLALDGEKKFSEGLRTAQASVRLCKQEVSNFSNECKGNANTVENLAKKNELLQKSQEAYDRALNAAKAGQANALKTYRDAASRLDELKGKLQAVEEELADNDNATEEAKKEAEEYRSAIEKQSVELMRAETALANWDTKVSKAQGDVRKASREVEENSRYLEEAKNSADGCASSIDGFGKKIQEAGEKAGASAGEIESAGTAMSDLKSGFTTAIGMKAVDAIAGVGKAAVDAAKKLIEAGVAAAAYADDVLTTADVTGMSTDRIQELTYAAGLMDTELSTIEGSMRKNLASMRSAAKGTGEASDAYRKLGVEVTKADGTLRDSEDVYWDCIDALGKIEDSTERDSVAMQVFGKSAQELNPLISKGSKGFAELAQEAHNVGYVLDSETLGKLGAAQDSFDRLDMAGQNFSNAIGAAVAPALGGLADIASNVLNGIASLFRDNRTEAERFAGTISDTAKSLREELDGDWSESVVSSVGKLESYRDTLLEVVRAGEADEYQKTQLSKIVEELGSRVPELTAAWDEQTGTLNLTEEAVNSLINAEEEYVQKAALLEAKETAFRVKADAIIEQAKAQGLLNAKMREASKVYGENIETVEDLRDAVDAMYLNPELSGSELHRNMETLLKEAEAAEGAFKDCVPAIEEADKEIEAIGLAAEEMGADLEDAGETAETALGEVAAAAEGAAEGTSSAIQSFADAAVEMRATVQEAFDEAHDSAKSAFSVDAFESWAKDAENGIAKMQESLENQVGAMQDYSRNFAIVSDELRETSPEFLSYIQDLGKDGAQLVEELAKVFENGDTETAKQLIEKYKDALDAQDAIAEISGKNAVALKVSLGELSSTAEEWTAFDAAIQKIKESELPNVLAEELEKTVQLAKDEGIKIPEGLASEIESSDDPKNAALTCIMELNGAIEGKKAAVYSISHDTGRQVGAGLEQGIREKYNDVINAAAGTIDAAVVATRKRAEVRSPSKLFRREVGQFLPAGLAEGIRDGNSLTAEAASEQMDATLAAMKNWFRKNKAGTDEIAQTWQAVATAALKNSFGISRTKTEGGGDKQKTVQKTRNEYSSDILQVATSYLANLKELYDVSTKQEISYWKSVRARLDSGTQAWITASGKIRKLQKQASQEAKAERASEKRAESQHYADRLSAMENYVSHREAMGRMSAKQERKYWQEHISEFEKGSSQYKKISEKLVSLEKQAASERLSVMESYVSHREAMGRMSTKKERDYWLKYIAEFEKGSDQYKKISEKLVSLEAQIVSERLAKYEAYIQRQTALQRMSVAREREYWKQRLAEFKKGSDEYKSIQERLATLEASIGTSDVAASVLASYQTYYDMSEKAEKQYWDIIRKTYKAGTADRLAADQAYLAAREKLQNRLADIESDYTDRINDATARYKDAVAARREAIYSAFGLFDAFESNSATGGELLFNIQSQAAGYEEWIKSLEELQERGIFSDSLMKELTDKGPTDIAAIKALLSLTDDQMKLYQEAYDKKLELSDKQAKTENADLKEEVKEEIKNLKTDMAAAMAAANEPITDELKAVATKIETVAEDQTAAIVAAFTGSGSSLAKSVGDSVSSSTQSAVGLTGEQTNGLTEKQNEEERRRREEAHEAESRAQAEAERTKDAERLRAEIEASRKEEEEAAKRRREETEKEARKAERNKALDAINSAKKLKSPLTEEQRKRHAKIYQYLADKYGVAGSASLYARLASIFGLPDYKGTGPERMKILEALKAHGLREGTTNAAGGAAWIDEDLDSTGPEIVVRKSDKAILTRLQAADAVIPADLSKNLFAWGAYNPEGFGTASMAYLNDKLAQAYNAQAQSSRDNLAAINQIIGILGDYLPHITDGHEICLDTGVLVGALAGEMSRELARRSRRTIR
ncbi:MAG: hypothetical protein IKS06_08355 [Lachnospiraceae bacterium]|nr:hypothetical protein [Lachnospiraceae bacterium]